MVMGSKRTAKRRRAGFGWFYDKRLAENKAEKCLVHSPNRLDRIPRQPTTTLGA